MSELQEINECEQFPLDATLLELFQSQVSYSPNATAIIEPRKQITYSQLNIEVNQLAKLMLEKLTDNFIEANEFVAILLPQSINFIKSILAIWTIGKVPVPLSVDYPISQLKFILEEDLGNPLLISTSTVVQMIVSSSSDDDFFNFCPTILLDIDLSKGDRCEEFSREFSSIPHEIAYCFFTSGSTGRPKGVLLKHRSYINVVNWAVEQCQITSQDRSLAFCAPVFDVSILEIWPLLSKGAIVCIPPSQCRYDVNLLRNWMDEQKITITALPTAVGTRLLGNIDECCLRLNRSLRWMLIGGEALTFYPSANLKFEIINLYGPTEAAVLATFTIVKKSSNSEEVPVIGRPINTNVLVELLDSDSNSIQKPYQNGEICVAGVGLAQGYLNREKLTLEKFIENPYNNNSSNPEFFSKLYRTGDLGYWDPDGNLCYAGRIDSQIKVHGFRIELGNIEQTLCQVQVIGEAVVLLEQDPGTDNSNKSLVAYCILKCEVSDKKPDESESHLFDFLKSRLAHYEIPSRVYTFPFGVKFPLTVSGKVDRKQLSFLKSFGTLLKSSYEPLSTTTEILLGQIWSEFLNIPFSSIGKHENFFSLGGTSIIAMQMLDKLQYNLENAGQKMQGIQLHHIFRSQTIFEIAKLVDQRSLPLQQVDLPYLPSKFENLKTGISLSRPQQLIWRQMSKLSESEWFHYNQAISVKFNNIPEVSLLNDVIVHLINQHEALTLRLRLESTGPVLDRFTSEPDEIMNKQIFPYKNRIFSWKECRQILQSNSDVDLVSGEDGGFPLVKFFIMQTAPSTFQVHIIGHQLLLDATSFNVLVWELQHHMKMKLRPSEVDPETARELAMKSKYSYIDYINWENMYECSPEYAASLRFWKVYLENWNPIQFKSSLPTKSLPYFGLVLPFQLDAKLTKKIRTFTKYRRTTLFNILLTAYKALLFFLSREYPDSCDLSIVSVVLGRDNIDFSETIGHFTQPIIIRTKDITSQLTFETLLDQIRENVTTIYEHSSIPFLRVLDTMDPKEQLFTACLQMIPRSPMQLQSARNIFQVYESQLSQQIMLTFEEENSGNNQFEGFLEVNSNVFSTYQACKFVDNFKTAVQFGIEFPSKTLEDLNKLLKI